MAAGRKGRQIDESLPTYIRYYRENQEYAQNGRALSRFWTAGPRRFLPASAVSHRHCVDLTLTYL